MEILTSDKAIEKPAFANIPRGAKIIEISEGYYCSMYAPNDTFTERVVMEYRGKVVCILRYEQDDNQIMVFVGDRAKVTTVHGIDDFIEQNTGGA